MFLLLVGNSLVYAQKITGKVTSLKKGLNEVKIQLKGTSIECKTNTSGFFTIDNVKPGSYTIVATFNGYKSTEKAIEVEGHVTIVRLEMEEE